MVEDLSGLKVEAVVEEMVAEEGEDHLPVVMVAGLFFYWLLPWRYLPQAERST